MPLLVVDSTLNQPERPDSKSRRMLTTGLNPNGSAKEISMNPYSHLLMSFVIVAVAGLVIFGQAIWQKVSAPFRWFSRRMKDLTGDYSGEDSDQWVAPPPKYPLGTLVEYQGHRGGPRWGTVVGSREHGLHGQARVNVGPGKFSAWRSWSKLEKVQ